ncbi:MAG TPA: L,D-transpeptidase [Longimicrobium sp.]|nr:L,D-transpeptidase [Longimicrobium sp.]
MAGRLATVAAAVVAACAPPPAHAASPPDTARIAEQTGLALVLNLPAFRLDLREGGDVVRSYTVAVGSRRYRTPLGRFAVSRVELNPWWYPPSSAWARRDTVTPPGPRNPMGRAKLNFHELYFLHGTPQEQSLGSAASHGCVRMANADALDLARRVLAAGRPEVAAEEIEAAAQNHRRTRRYALQRSVPLEIVYRTAEVRDGALELHPDVYRRERTTLRSRALQALREAGIDEEWVDAEQLGKAVRAARSEQVRVALDALLRMPVPRPPPPPAASMIDISPEERSGP